MFKVAFNSDMDEDYIIKEFNKVEPREHLEVQVCFSTVKGRIQNGYKDVYLAMTLLEGVEEFISKLNEEFKNINIVLLDRKQDDYLIKISVSEKYNKGLSRGITLYVVCCLIRLFYRDNFGKLGNYDIKVPEYLKEDVFKFIIKRNKECIRSDSLHCLYDYEDEDLLTKEVILAFDNIKIMNSSAKRVAEDIYNIDNKFAQNNIIYNTIQCLPVRKEI